MIDSYYRMGWNYQQLTLIVLFSVLVQSQGAFHQTLSIIYYQLDDALSLHLLINRVWQLKNCLKFYKCFMRILWKFYKHFMRILWKIYECFMRILWKFYGHCSIDHMSFNKLWSNVYWNIDHMIFSISHIKAFSNHFFN